MAVKFDPPPICAIAGISCLIKFIALFKISINFSVTLDHK